MVEPVLELSRSVHGAHFFPEDEVARKTWRNWRYGNDSATSYASLKAWGPDLPKREAALAAEAKVMEFLVLAKTFTQDSSLFELGTPIKCFRKQFETHTKSISQEMIKQASSRLHEAVGSIRSEVDGVGDGKAWSASSHWMTSSSVTSSSS